MELTRPARRQAARMRIAFRLFKPADFIQRLRPGHKRNFTNIDVRRQVISVLAGQRTRTRVPVAELTCRSAKHRMAIRIPWSRSGRRSLRLTASATLLGKTNCREQQTHECNDSDRTNSHSTLLVAAMV